MADEKKDTIHMTLKDGVVVIETKTNVSPKHVKQIKQLIEEGQYDGVVFHRVIDGFRLKLETWNSEIQIKMTSIYQERELVDQIFLI